MYSLRVLSNLRKWNKNYLKSFTLTCNKAYVPFTTSSANANLFSIGINNTLLTSCERCTLGASSVPRNFYSSSSVSYIDDNEVLPKKSRRRKNSLTSIVKEVGSLLNPEDSTIIQNKEELQEYRSTFPTPKNVLDNVYAVVATELKNQRYKLSPTYKHRKLDTNTSIWTCTFATNWPEELKFVSSNKSKRVACSDAALSVLVWLKKNGKINDKNQPLIYDKETLKSLKKEQNKISVLRLTPDSEAKLSRICDTFEGQMQPIIKESIKALGDTENVKDAQVAEFSHINSGILKQRFMGTDFYKGAEVTKLPISEHKEAIISLSNSNQVVVIKGEPGCGKSTRVPQYLLEGWAREAGKLGEPCQILVTQPRRIAAISLAERVAHERNEKVGATVGFTVRLHSAHNPRTTRLHYLTTGVLLRRVQSDPTLRHCTHVILDEAHERDVNTDLLMNLLRQALAVNAGLKVVVMSATIDADVFRRYFEGFSVGVMHVPGFTYPVEDKYLDDMDLQRLDLSKTEKMIEGGEGEEVRVIPEDVAQVIMAVHKSKPPGAILCFLSGWEDIRKIRDLLPQSRDMFVLCLHSRLQEDEQRKIFNKPPPGIRKIILATNIAETSVTIDDVVYVVDAGICKERTLDVDKGIVCLDNHWISSASASQRRGRAGRCQPGHAYHLYTRDKYNTFIPYTLPEILRTSLTKIVLDSKVYSNNLAAVDFLRKLPSPPEEQAVINAVDELKDLELLDANECLTPLGRTLSEFQLEPKLAKALVNSVVFNCVTPVVDIITLFSAETEIFASSLHNKDAIARLKQAFSDNSDHLALMRIFEKWLDLYENEEYEKSSRFCYHNNLLDYKLVTLNKLRGIHFGYLVNGLHNVLGFGDTFSDNDEMVKGVLLSGIGTLLQYRNWNIVKGRMKKSNILLTRHNHHASISSESVNHKINNFPTDFLLYINETRSNIKRTTTIRETSFISPLSVLLFSNKKLTVEDIPESELSPDLDAANQLLLGLENSKIKCICDRNQANAIVRCKESIFLGYQYYINQLTHGNEKNERINELWMKILKDLNDILIDLEVSPRKSSKRY